MFVDVKDKKAYDVITVLNICSIVTKSWFIVNVINLPVFEDFVVSNILHTLNLAKAL